MSDFKAVLIIGLALIVLYFALMGAVFMGEIESNEKATLEFVGYYD